MKLNSIIFLLLTCVICNAQDISIFKQFNGRYDYIAIGNTMNAVENGPNTPCEILTSSSAEFNLDTDSTIIAAYLYWAGSGVDEDLDIELNGVKISAERKWNKTFNNGFSFYGAFAEVTNILTDIGNGTYTVSNLDLSEAILSANYCDTGTNFSGWAITVIFQNDDLPLNQVNIYDGIESVPSELEIVLTNLNVFDNEGAKIGFIAWEGDNALAVNESLRINGNVISNPPLNPASNAFNGTNSFTGLSGMHNMDIDFYSIQNNISIGDTSAIISLTSGQDFVMINNIITVLNSRLSDGTITINDYIVSCDTKLISVSYNVNNFNSTDPLPINTPIAFYANDILVGLSQTDQVLQINETINYTTALNIPNTIPLNFELTIVIDDSGNSVGTINEINEINNTATLPIELFPEPNIVKVENLQSCNLEFNSANFNLLEVITPELEELYQKFTFFENITDLNTNTNSIFDLDEYMVKNQVTQTIYIKAETESCFDILTFKLHIINCPPNIPNAIGISPNNDGTNDVLNIPGLYNIFLDHELLIYNRYGTLIFEGTNNLKWNGISNRGINKNNELPTGTYFYIIKLNQDNFKPLTGYIYLNK